MHSLSELFLKGGVLVISPGLGGDGAGEEIKGQIGEHPNNSVLEVISSL